MQWEDGWILHFGKYDPILLRHWVSSKDTKCRTMESMTIESRILHITVLNVCISYDCLAWYGCLFRGVPVCILFGKMLYWSMCCFYHIPKLCNSALSANEADICTFIPLGLSDCSAALWLVPCHLNEGKIYIFLHLGVVHCSAALSLVPCPQRFSVNWSPTL